MELIEGETLMNAFTARAAQCALPSVAECVTSALAAAEKHGLSMRFKASKPDVINANDPVMGKWPGLRK
jgi:hypothetical protein